MSTSASEDSARWNAALELYHGDDLDAAWHEVEKSGIGESAVFAPWYRLIEAEYVSRRQSKQVRLRPWLEFEFVPHQLQGLEQQLSVAIVEACDRVADRLGWQHTVPTLICILAQETDAPWATNPYGYCTEKIPYEKICLPDHLVDDPVEFRQAVAHEYAHVISLNLADGYAPRWLEEAVSVLAEDEGDPSAFEELSTNPESWLTPHELEAMFEATSDEDHDKVWLAYQQSGWIGRWLDSHGEPDVLRKLLSAHTNERAWRNMLMTVRGLTRTDQALLDTVGINTQTLFSRVCAWLREIEPTSSE
jgi:hypothetical protein